jgi:hypothetical protein
VSGESSKKGGLAEKRKYLAKAMGVATGRKKQKLSTKNAESTEKND